MTREERPLRLTGPHRWGGDGRGVPSSLEHGLVSPPYLPELVRRCVSGVLGTHLYFLTSIRVGLPGDPLSRGSGKS